MSFLPTHCPYCMTSSLSRWRLIESNTTLREGRGNPIRVSKICNPRRGLSIPESLPHCGVWLFFSFLSKNVQNMSKTPTRRDFSRLFGVDVLWRHRWITSGMGLSHPPGWDNISPDVKIGGYSCLKSEKNLTLWLAITFLCHRLYVPLCYMNIFSIVTLT